MPSRTCRVDVRGRPIPVLGGSTSRWRTLAHTSSESGRIMYVIWFSQSSSIYMKITKSFKQLRFTMHSLLY